MQNLVEASAGQAWSYGGSILTFLVPMIAFVVVASALLVLYTKPGVVPGRRPGAEMPVGATRMPGVVESSGKHAEGGRASGTQASGTAASPQAPASAE